ncbi:S-adenosyl-L-methionine-dependent methyltransferase-22 [Coleophoma crateriformis]|uniref:S-adenosyl-L-methionine-dependent methyltransferase-22 n=1 Tax=Coleophoma crateriformis TaxID=565419 RepID=A0A3D8QYG1_9HELO|nr:S-adenosyl-L-methionine-dependent methyltransferase-22 [Coleophoma crateriformis]
MSSTRPVQSVTTAELYERWAKVYDTDGNILQAIDDVQLPALLQSAFSPFQAGNPAAVLELGCGTGRNTLKLLSPPYASKISKVTAVDLSASMLAVAQSRCRDLAQSPSRTPAVEFSQYDALQPTALPGFQNVDIILSTLVLEHLPLATFFTAVKSLLKPGGTLVLTNMHSEMGARSQAGFVDPESGEKIRGLSFAHEIEQVLDFSKRLGFLPVGDVVERGIEEKDLGDGVVGERGRKWVGISVWFGLVLRLE